MKSGKNNRPRKGMTPIQQKQNMINSLSASNGSLNQQLQTVSQ
jgi:hypothetical protein